MPDEYGDEDELNYIIEQGQREAEEFGEWSNNYGPGKPAKWLNPPRPVPGVRPDLFVTHDYESVHDAIMADPRWKHNGGAQQP